jgi:hypothetical protein
MHNNAFAAGQEHNGIPVLAHHVSHTDHDEIARADMHAFAEHNLDGFTELPDTFGATSDWNGDWELRWVDYHGHHHNVRIYHIISKHHDGNRYTYIGDVHLPHGGHWEAVH